MNNIKFRLPRPVFALLVIVGIMCLLRFFYLPAYSKFSEPAGTVENRGLIPVADRHFYMEVYDP